MMRDKLLTIRTADKSSIIKSVIQINIDVVIYFNKMHRIDIRRNNSRSKIRVSKLRMCLIVKRL